jgi:hypothetical protein
VRFKPDDANHRRTLERIRDTRERIRDTGTLIVAASDRLGEGGEVAAATASSSGRSIAS